MSVCLKMNVFCTTKETSKANKSKMAAARGETGGRLMAVRTAVRPGEINQRLHPTGSCREACLESDITAYL